MKKTYNLNLNGLVFCIDEDAFLQLQHYIKTLERHYLKEEGGKEIMQDIESRIAELFRESLQQNYKEAISLPDIEQVVRIMGTPDAIIDETNGYANMQQTKHKLYRDPDTRILGGVAAGIAAYMGISVIWIRLALLLLSLAYGLTIPVYIILWGILPKAVTAKQKLEMKGEIINISNLENNIRDSCNKIKKNSKLQKFLNDAGRIIATFFTAFLRITGKIFFTSVSILGLLGGGVLFVYCGWFFLFSGEYTPDISCQPTGPALYPPFLWLFRISVMLLINIPMFLIICYSTCYLFKFRLHKTVLLTSVSLWIIACLTAIFIKTEMKIQENRRVEPINIPHQEVVSRAVPGLHRPHLPSDSTATAEEGKKQPAFRPTLKAGGPRLLSARPAHAGPPLR